VLRERQREKLFRDALSDVIEATERGVEDLERDDSVRRLRDFIRAEEKRWAGSYTKTRSWLQPGM
jgi:hypothetical protein